MCLILQKSYLQCKSRCTLRHLDEQREAHEHCQRNIPRLAIVHIAEREKEDRFEKERQELGPDASAESEELVHEVTGDPAQGSSEEVHQAEGSGQGRRVTGRHLEVGPEMGCQLVVPWFHVDTENAMSRSCEIGTQMPIAARVHGKLGSLVADRCSSRWLYTLDVQNNFC